MIQIVNDRAIAGGAPVKFVPSPNVGGRMQPIAIVVHDTAGPSAASAINTFKAAASKVSAHVVVALDGAITQMVEFDAVGWHAGKSVLDGKRECNQFTIGIEIVNPGMLTKRGEEGLLIYRENGREKIVGRYPIDKCQPMKTPEHGNGYWLPYTPEQIDAVTELCQALVKAYPTIKQIVPHWYISPKRKIDTNPLFPLETLREAVFRPQSAPVATVSVLQVGSDGRPVEMAQRRLQELGYPVGLVDGKFGASMETAVFGFERQNGLTVDGILDAHELAVLHSDKAKAMPIASRESVSVKELASVSRGVSDLLNIKNAGVATGVLGAAGATAQQAAPLTVTATPAPVLDPSVVEQLSKGAEGAGYARTIVESLGGFVSAVGSNGWFQIMVLGFLVVVVANRVLGFRVEDFRLGRWTPSGGK